MSWLRLDDGFAEHPKVLELAKRGKAWGWLELLLYCARRGSGSVPAVVLERFGLEADELEGLGLLDRDEDGGLHVHDWLAYNGAKSGAQRTAEWRERHWGARPAQLESMSRGERRRRRQALEHGGRRGVYAGDELENGSTASSVTARDDGVTDGDGDVTSLESSSVRARSPSPYRTTPTSTVDVGEGLANGLTVGHELLASRLLEAVGDVDDARADYVRGAVLRLPESVSSGLLELVQAGHARDRLAYVLGSLRAELANRGLSG